MANQRKQKDKMDMQAMMEVYTKLATPGAPHKALARMAGTWNAKMKSWMEPDKPPMESTQVDTYFLVWLSYPVIPSPVKGLPIISPV